MHRARLLIMLTLTIFLAGCGGNDNQNNGNHMGPGNHEGHDRSNSGPSK